MVLTLLAAQSENFFNLTELFLFLIIVWLILRVGIWLILLPFKPFCTKAGVVKSSKPASFLIY